MFESAHPCGRRISYLSNYCFLEPFFSLLAALKCKDTSCCIYNFDMFCADRRRNGASKDNGSNQDTEDRSQNLEDRKSVGWHRMVFCIMIPLLAHNDSRDVVNNLGSREMLMQKVTQI